MAVRIIPLEEAQRRLAQILDGLSPGEEVVLTRDNKAVARLRATDPPSHTRPRRFGTLKGTIVSIAPDFDAIPEGFEDYLP